jgi:DNA-binding transcriptional LysR family regulator
LKSELFEHLEKLRYFIVIAEAGSFHQASKQLRIAQPALSKSMKILENACGASLFIRNRTGVILTSDGSELLITAKSIAHSAASFESRISQQQKSRSIGFVTHEVLGPIVFARLAKWMSDEESNSELSLRIETNPSVSQLIKLIESYKHDVGVIAASPQRAGLQVTPLYTEVHSFYASKSFCERHALTSEKIVKENKVHILPLIFSPDVLAGTNETFADYMKRKKIPVTPKHIVGSIESAAALTMQGFGIGLLPRVITSATYGEKLVRLRLENFPLNDFGKYNVNFVCRSESWKRDPMTMRLFKKLRTV